MKVLDTKKSEEINEKYEASFYRIIDNLYDQDNKLKDFSEMKEKHDNLEPAMLKLFDSSYNDLFYWDFCPINVYEYHYNSRLGQFCNDFPGSSEVDFINIEKRTIKKRFWVRDDEDNISDKSTIVKEDTLHLVLDDFFYPFNISLFQHELALRIFLAQKKKLEFLDRKIEAISNPSINAQSEQEILINLSNSNDAMKVVYLHELGILDFLKEKMHKEMNFSVNNMAQVISAFTSIDVTTAQPYLNPIYSSGVDQKKNPLKPKNIERAWQKLSDLGFSLKKTT
ncbi:hypothetical protein [Draconibacterium orientale]|nr:hypothetical protein [Draconibacterium orientale]